MALFEDEDGYRRRLLAQEAGGDGVPSTSELRDLSSRLRAEALRADVTRHLYDDEPAGRPGGGRAGGTGPGTGGPNGRGLPALLQPLRPLGPVPALALGRGGGGEEKDGGRVDDGAPVRKVDYLRRPPLAAPGQPGGISAGSKMGSRLKSAVEAAEAAALSARDEYHLTADDERFFM